MTVLDAVDYLRKRIHSELGVRTPERVPNPRPSEFVLVVRNGGGRVDTLREAPRVDIHCWANETARARELSDACAEIMFGLNRDVADGFISCVETTRRFDPDPDSEQPRYYGSYLLNTYKY